MANRSARSRGDERSGARLYKICAFGPASGSVALTTSRTVPAAASSETSLEYDELKMVKRGALSLESTTVTSICRTNK